MDIPTRQGSEEIAHAGEYLDWSPEGAPVSIQMHLDAIDGIRRDVIEERSAEVGGLLLGGVESGGHPSVRIDRYQRIPCGHRLGPQFVLDQEDQAALVAAAESVLKTGDLSVVGLYRSHTRPGLQLEMADFEIMARYFSDPSDVMLLVKPESGNDITARFFRREPDAGAQPVGPAFPFRGRALSLRPMDGAEEEQTARSAAVKPDAPERPRRLVPDFVPLMVEPSRTPRPEPALLAATSTAGKRERNWWPLLAAILLAGGGACFLLQPEPPCAFEPRARGGDPAADRPLGLYVDPAGQTWHVSWNPNATALHDARTVQLFVREGDDQNRIDLSPHDLAAGIYQYRPAGQRRDVPSRGRGELGPGVGGIVPAHARALPQAPAAATARPAAPPAVRHASRNQAPLTAPRPWSPPASAPHHGPDSHRRARAYRRTTAA